MSRPMQVDETATRAAREAQENGIKVLDAIFDYDRERKAGEGVFAAASRRAFFRRALWSGLTLKRGGPQKSGTIKSGNWDNPNIR